VKCWEKALNCLEEVVKCDPNHSSAWGQLGAVYLAQGKSEEALVCYNNALGLMK
jgi:cytochrome c-type biogenesis protein CcmH/NrfG